MGRLASTEIAGVNDQMKDEHQKKKRKEKKIPTVTAEATLCDWQVISGNSRAKKKKNHKETACSHSHTEGFISPANL